MRKLLLMLVLLIAGAVAGSAAVKAQVAEAAKQQVVTMTELQPAAPQQALGSVRDAQLAHGDFMEGKVTTPVTDEISAAQRTPRKAATADDYAGTRQVITHPSTGLLYTNQATVTKITDDSVSIKAFIYSEVTIGAKLDLSTGKVTIVPQHVLDITAGPLSICPVDPDKKVYSLTDPIEGTISDGGIHITTPFGFFVTEGDQKGAYLNIGFQTWAEVVTANGRVTNNVISYDTYLSTKRRSVSTATDWVYVRQTGADKARIAHIPTQAGYVALEVNLGYDQDVTADPQPLYYRTYYGNYCNYSMTETVTTGDTAVTVSAQLLTPMSIGYAAADSTTLSFGKWLVGSTSGGVNTMFESSQFVTSAQFTFPTKPVFDLDGSGTESDPYLLKTADDFSKLAVATLTDATRCSADTTDKAGNTFTPVWQGKHFAVVADIDFSTSTLSVKPVGNNTLRFDGTLDGRGYTLSNFEIDNYAYDYVGLFGTLGSDGTIKNLNFKDCEVSTVGYNDAIVAGKNYGTITGVQLENCSVSVSNSGIYAGLVTGNSYGPVSDIKVEGGSVAATYFLGGLVGRSYSDITNCQASGITVYGNGSQAYMGGIVGYIAPISSSTGSVKITDCAVSGLVYSGASQMCIGGVIGEIAYGEVARCQASARVLAGSAKDVDLGGVSGALFKSDLHDCAFSGLVSNSVGTKVGGIVGAAASISGQELTCNVSNCYSAAMVECEDADSIKGAYGSATNIVATNVYFDSQMAGFTEPTMGKLTSELTSAAGLAGFDPAVWTFTEGLYPRLKSIDTTDVVVVAAAPVILDSTDNVKMVKNNFTYATANDVQWSSVYQNQFSSTGGYAFTFDDGVGRLNYKQYTDSLYVKRGNAYKWVMINIAPMPLSGEGTAASPWLITSREDVHSLSDISNNAQITFDDSYFLVTADIDMQGDTIAPVNNDTNGKLRFEGNFNGAGHTIDNFVVCTTAYYEEGNSSGKPAGEVNPRDDKSSYYGGLFGNLGENGVIRNLVIGSKAQVKAFSYGGVIAGQSYGLIDSCANYGSIDVYYSRAGGIAGMLNSGAVVSHCYNAGTVRAGYYQAGGIAGYMSDATISDCENAGLVQATYINSYQAEGKQSTAGGIVGDVVSGTVTNVVNAGPVESYSKVGGIAGNVSKLTLTGAVNYGLVKANSSKSSSGQIVGTATTLTVADAYYDSQLQRLGGVSNATVDGVTAYTTDSLTTGSIEALPADAFNQGKGIYPVIAVAADRLEAHLASLAPVYFAENENATCVAHAATLGNPDKVTWSVKKGTAFAVSDGTLTPTIPQSGAVTDTLVAELSGAQRLLPVCTLNPDIFDGDGTLATPYLIKTTDDVDALRSLIAETDYDYSGAHFLVVNDIDFTGTTFSPVAEAPYSFSADFNGDGHTFKGITYDVSSNTTNSCAALFGTVGVGGVIRNLTIDQSSFKGYTNVAAVVSELYGTVSHVTNKASVSAVTSYAGGIAAQARSGSKILACTNTADVEVKKNYAGGILGYSAAGADMDIDSCYNSGLITGTSYLGGIAGYASASYYRCANVGDVLATAKYAGGITSYAASPSSAACCYNTGNITATYYVAGIAGCVPVHAANRRFVADSCYNTGELITATGTTSYYMGGIIGDAKAGVSITRCYNTGNVQVESGVKAYNVGGIAGQLAGAAAAPDTISSCYNTGSTNAYNKVGGIAGAFTGNDNAVLTACHNEGSVNATNASTGQAGGLVGSGGCQFYDSWNAGTVTALGVYVGGIAGQLTGSGYHVERCANYADITATSATKGNYVGGLIGWGRPLMQDCYNFGSVNGYNYVAGILGFPGNAQAASYFQSMTQTYNAAQVTGQTDNVDNIMPYNANCKYISVGNTWYDSEITSAGTNDNSINAKGLTKREFTELQISDAFKNATACYPSLVSLDTVDYNSLAVAMVLLAEGDRLDSVTVDFQIGTPTGAVWTSTSNLSISGNQVTLQNAESPEPATLTLTVGKLSRTWQLVIYRDPTGVDHAQVAREVDSREVYDLAGRRISRPADAQGFVIVVTHYTDGTTTTEKQLGPVK